MWTPSCDTRSRVFRASLRRNDRLGEAPSTDDAARALRHLAARHSQPDCHGTPGRRGKPAGTPGGSDVPSLMRPSCLRRQCWRARFFCPIVTGSTLALSHRKLPIYFKSEQTFAPNGERYQRCPPRTTVTTPPPTAVPGQAPAPGPNGRSRTRSPHSASPASPRASPRTRREEELRKDGGHHLRHRRCHSQVGGGAFAPSRWIFGGYKSPDAPAQSIDLRFRAKNSLVSLAGAASPEEPGRRDGLAKGTTSTTAAPISQLGWT